MFSLSEFEEGRKQIEKETGVPFWVHVHRRARFDDKVLIALISKMVPNQEIAPEDGDDLLNAEVEFLGVPENGDGKEKFGRFFN